MRCEICGYRVRNDQDTHNTGTHHKNKRGTPSKIRKNKHIRKVRAHRMAIIKAKGFTPSYKNTSA